MTTSTDTWLTRIQALLTKAESTEFPDEAEALVAKAQELMARHSIDESMLAAAGTGPAPTATSTRIIVPGPYASAKASLLTVVGRANGCMVIHLGSGAEVPCEVFGFPVDVEMVESLYASLLIQGASALTSTPVPEYDSPRRFRHAFMLSYAARLGQRLADATAKAQADYETETGQSTALVLVDRSRAVEQALRAEHPNIRMKRTTSSSGAGRRAGTAAADRANLGNPSVGAGARRALNA